MAVEKGKRWDRRKGREGEEERRKKGCANPVLFKAVL